MHAGSDETAFEELETDLAATTRLKEGSVIVTD